MPARTSYAAARLFTGRGEIQRDWALLVEGERIAAVGPLLYPYDRAPWQDQVVYEPERLRIAGEGAVQKAYLPARLFWCEQFLD
jgi:hypothetical protein